MIDDGYLTIVYASIQDQALKAALFEYCKHFKTVFPINLVDYVSTKDLNNAVTNNQELVPEENGKIY